MKKIKETFFSVADIKFNIFYSAIATVIILLLINETTLTNIAFGIPMAFLGAFVTHLEIGVMTHYISKKGSLNEFRTEKGSSPFFNYLWMTAFVVLTFATHFFMPKEMSVYIGLPIGIGVGMIFTTISSSIFFRALPWQWKPEN